MLILSILSLGIWAIAFYFCAKNDELRDRISYLLTERRELSQRLLTIAHGSRTLIRDIEEDSGDGSYYISSPRYLLSRIENIYDVTGYRPLAAPVKPSAKADEPSVVEPEPSATDSERVIGTTFPTEKEDHAKGSAE